ncbi:unnamed protein product [Amoebophrya sp. A120]|nr:unnamed protein product [Amoebophrya sp. A120]|eukprot:GSA120T00010414001.1
MAPGKRRFNKNGNVAALYRAAEFVALQMSCGGPGTASATKVPPEVVPERNPVTKTAGDPANASGGEEPDSSDELSERQRQTESESERTVSDSEHEAHDHGWPE